MELPETERLANALYKAGAPPELCNRARLGFYDMHKSELTFPRLALLSDLRDAGLYDFALRVMNGEF